MYTHRCLVCTTGYPGDAHVTAKLIECSKVFCLERVHLTSLTQKQIISKGCAQGIIRLMCEIYGIEKLATDFRHKDRSAKLSQTCRRCYAFSVCIVFGMLHSGWESFVRKLQYYKGCAEHNCNVTARYLLGFRKHTTTQMTYDVNRKDERKKGGYSLNNFFNRSTYAMKINREAVVFLFSCLHAL